jgi:uncharacterized membrane protein
LVQPSILSSRSIKIKANLKTMQAYLITLLSLIAIDGLWLGVITRSFYKKYLGYIFAEQVTIWPVIIFYLLYAFGVVYFVVTPAIQAGSLTLAISRGALLGLLAYGAYDLTNQATLANWPVIITIADMAWGVFITALVSAIAYTIVSK